MKNLFNMFIIAFLALTLTSFAGDPVKNENKMKVQIIAETANDLIDLSTISLPVPIGSVVLATDEIAKASTKSIAKFQREWVPNTESGTTTYYKEYETVYCPPTTCGASYGYFTWATGRCKSTSGTIYDCSAGQ
jgi:hypothetical protein